MRRLPSILYALCRTIILFVFAGAALFGQQHSIAAQEDFELIDGHPFPAQTTYAGPEGYCDVSMGFEKINRHGEIVLAIMIRNLGAEELTIYNPFFYHSLDGHIHCRTAKLMIYDDQGRLISDPLNPTNFHSPVFAVAPRWMSLQPLQSFKIRFQFDARSLLDSTAENVNTSPDSARRLYIQAVFLDRFLSQDPSGRPPLPMDRIPSDQEMVSRLFGPGRNSGDPRHRAWIDRHSGREVFRSNVVIVPVNIRRVDYVVKVEHRSAFHWIPDPPSSDWAEWSTGQDLSHKTLTIIPVGGGKIADAVNPLSEADVAAKVQQMRQRNFVELLANRIVTDKQDRQIGQSTEWGKTVGNVRCSLQLLRPGDETKREHNPLRFGYGGSISRNSWDGLRFPRQSTVDSLLSDQPRAWLRIQNTGSEPAVIKGPIEFLPQLCNPASTENDASPPLTTAGIQRRLRICGKRLTGSLRAGEELSCMIDLSEFYQLKPGERYYVTVNDLIAVRSPDGEHWEKVNPNSISFTQWAGRPVKNVHCFLQLLPTRPPNSETGKTPRVKLTIQNVSLTPVIVDLSRVVVPQLCEWTPEETGPPIVPTLEGRIIQCQSSVSDPCPITLHPGEERTCTIDLDNYYSLAPGKTYQLTFIEKIEITSESGKHFLLPNMLRFTAE